MKFFLEENNFKIGKWVLNKIEKYINDISWNLKN